MSKVLERYEIVEQYFQAEQQYMEAMGDKVCNIPEDVIKELSIAFTKYWEAGRELGLKEAHKIVNDVVGESIRKELKVHPNMKLSTYAKNYGYIKEEEK